VVSAFGVFGVTEFAGDEILDVAVDVVFYVFVQIPIIDLRFQEIFFFVEESVDFVFSILTQFFILNFFFFETDLFVLGDLDCRMYLYLSHRGLVF
jgi:hypothetical protein